MDGRRGVRHRPVRLARAERAAAGEELRLLGARVPADLRPARSRARPLRRLWQGGRFHRQGGGAGRAQGTAASSAARLHRRGRRCRRDRRRADLVRRRGARLGDVRRLRAQCRKRRWRWAMCRRRSPTRADGFEIELLGKRHRRAHAARAAVRRQSRADAGMKRAWQHEQTSRIALDKAAAHLHRPAGGAPAGPALLAVEGSTASSSNVAARCRTPRAPAAFRSITSPMSSIAARSLPHHPSPAGRPIGVQRQGRSADGDLPGGRAGRAANG